MICVLISAIISFSPFAQGQALENAEKEQKRLETDKANLQTEIKMLEKESARIRKLVAEKQVVINKLKTELAQLQKQHADLTASVKASEKGEVDADAEIIVLGEELKKTRSEVEKITVQASLATTEYEQKREALLAKKAELMAQKAMLKQRTDEHNAATKAFEEESAAVNRDIARMNQSDEESAPSQKRKTKKVKRSAASGDAKPAQEDPYAPRADKSQRLFTIDP